MRPKFRNLRLSFLASLAGLVGLVALAACGEGPKGTLSGTVKADGSSTVFPITEAMAEEFQYANRHIRVAVGISGTGGGFKKFCAGETDVADASRPIKTLEAEACARNGVQYIELPVAFDGLSVVVNPENDWIDSLTVQELKRIWEPGSPIKKWSDLRPHWPNKNLALVGADTDSGTFDYFTEAVVGIEGASRPDYTASADDNILVQAVAGEKYALGYFGYAYYEKNPGKLKLVAIDPRTGPVAPSVETISNGTYQPLSRPLFIYVNRKAAEEKPEVGEFVRFFLDRDNAPLVRQVGYIPLTETINNLVRQRFEHRTTGSVFGGGSQVGVTLETLLAKE